MADKKDHLEITELFMAQADRDRRFYGTIQRCQDPYGHPVVYGKIMVLDGFILAQAACQDVLGEQLDVLVKMVLDYDIHKISGTDFIVSSN